MKNFVWIMCAMSLFVGGCADDAGGETLSLSFTNLTQLGEDFVYEGWLITPDGAVSSGRFTVDEAGDLSESDFGVDTEVADATTAFVLTIEPAQGDDPDPSATHLVAGDFADGEAALTIDHGAALGTDFSTAEGDYILATPSSDASDDDRQGIWWLVPGAPPSAGLSLPTLPAGWAYEGWVVGDEGPVSTGRFTDPAAEDSTGAGPSAGDDGCSVGGSCPPFPGDDFIDPAVNLVGHTAVISVEPDPDDSSAPFALKPLTHSIADITAPDTQEMDNTAGPDQPTGTASLTLP